MPQVGFVSSGDPLWQSTLRAMDEELVSDSLVYRYDPAHRQMDFADQKERSRSAHSCMSTPLRGRAGSTTRA